MIPDWEKIAYKAAHKAGIDMAEFLDDTYYLKEPPTPDVPTDALVGAVRDIDWDGEIEQAPKRMDGGYVDDSHEKSVYHFGLKDGLLEAKEIVRITLQSAAHKKAVKP